MVVASFLRYASPFAFAGPAGSLCNGDGRLLFLPHIESWMRGVRSKLMQWSMRLLKEEVWQNAAAAGSAGMLYPVY